MNDVHTMDVNACIMLTKFVEMDENAHIQRKRTRKGQNATKSRVVSCILSASTTIANVWKVDAASMPRKLFFSTVYWLPNIAYRLSFMWHFLAHFAIPLLVWFLNVTLVSSPKHKVLFALHFCDIEFVPFTPFYQVFSRIIWLHKINSLYNIAL